MYSKLYLTSSELFILESAGLSVDGVDVPPLYCLCLLRSSLSLRPVQVPPPRTLSSLAERSSKYLKTCTLPLVQIYTIYKTANIRYGL